MLLASNAEEIEEHLRELAVESRDMVKQIYQICWYMRGGVTREEAWELTYRERKEIFRIIDDNIKRVEKTGLALL